MSERPDPARSGSGTTPSGSTSPTPTSAPVSTRRRSRRAWGSRRPASSRPSVPGVTDFAEGDRVTYTGSPLGAYSTERVMGTEPLIKLPDGIGFETAAAMTMRGLTTSYLLRRIAPLCRRRHGAAARRRRRRRPDRQPVGAAARHHGDRHRVDRREGRDRPRPRLRRHDRLHRARTSRPGSASSPTAPAYRSSTTASARRPTPSSLDSLRRRGLLVCFGTASGPIPPIDAMQLAIKGSLFVTRPALADYIADPAERAELAGELFDHVAVGPDHDRRSTSATPSRTRSRPTATSRPAAPSAPRSSTSSPDHRPIRSKRDNNDHHRHEPQTCPARPSTCTR